MKTFVIPRLAFLTAVGLIVSLSINAATALGDWPQWRGLNRDGHSSDTGLLKQWPEDGPKLVWKATGLGSGYTSVSVVGDRLFAMGDKDDASYLIAINRANGKILWTTKVGKAGAPGWGGFAGPRCTPTVDDNLVFAVGQYGQVLCADTATGEEICARTTPKISAESCRSGGFAECPSWMATRSFSFQAARQAISSR